MNLKELKPIGDQILVRKVKIQQREFKVGEIIIPEVVRSQVGQESPRYEVLAIGKDVEEVAIGDFVFLVPYGLRKINAEGEYCATIREDDIMVII